jgi:hypothetical protein
MLFKFTLKNKRWERFLGEKVAGHCAKLDNMTAAPQQFPSPQKEGEN